MSLCSLWLGVKAEQYRQAGAIHKGARGAAGVGKGVQKIRIFLAGAPPPRNQRNFPRSAMLVLRPVPTADFAARSCRAWQLLVQ